MTNRNVKKKYRTIETIVIHLALWAWTLLMWLGPQWDSYNGNFSEATDFGFWNGIILMYSMLSFPAVIILTIVDIWHYWNNKKCRESLER